MNAAVTIETRILENFHETVNAHMKHLPGFELVIFGSDENEDFLSRNISNFIHHKLHFEKFGQHEYNLTLTNYKFWELLCEYDRVLIFQHDSMILRDGIDEFLEWDYVGSPWKFQQHGGNGGLSLRNPRLMFDLCKGYEWNPTLGNEDVFFCNLMRLQHIGKLAPRGICQQFACESIFQLGALGYHAIDSYLTPEQCEQIRNQYQKNIVPTSIS